MIKSKLIGKYKNISHGFFNKSDGHSDGIYRSLNCGMGSADNAEDVKKNLSSSFLNSQLGKKLYHFSKWNI